MNISFPPFLKIIKELLIELGPQAIKNSAYSLAEKVFEKVYSTNFYKKYFL